MQHSYLRKDYQHDRKTNGRYDKIKNRKQKKQKYERRKENTRSMQRNVEDIR